MRLGRTSELFLAGLISLGGISYVMMMPGRAASEWASSNDMIRQQFLQEGSVKPLSPNAARVALTALSLEDTAFSNNSIAALTASPTAEIDLGTAGILQVAIIDDDTRQMAYTGFAADVDERSPVVLERGNREAAVAVNYQREFSQPGNAERLDVAITPHAGVSVGPDGSAAGAGAEVRLGRFMDTRFDYPRWYLFAGADRRALLYDPAEGANFGDAMYLTHREVIGDAQAGIAMRVGRADLSLAYVHREYEHVAGVTKFDETEQFGAVTVNWRW